MDRPLILSAEGVNKSFAGFKAITDLNFYLAEGELRTVIGPNGAGKTTFLDLITGRTKPDTGTITFGATTELIPLSEHEIVRLGVGRKFQTPTVYTWKACAACGAPCSAGPQARMWTALMRS